MSEKRKAVSMRLRAFRYRRQLWRVTRRAFRMHGRLWHNCRIFGKILQKIMTGGIVSLFLFLAAVGAVTLIHPVMRELLLQFFS